MNTRDRAVPRYNPWIHLAVDWPEVDVVLEPMAGQLLGELRYPVISLRADSSAAQLRCTLAHELVHLERGVLDWGRWAEREEALVHAEAARRLVRLADLERALREFGGDADPAALAKELDVDVHTVRLRIGRLSAPERSWLHERLPRELWNVA
jgi:hypothetical protein